MTPDQLSSDPGLSISKYRSQTLFSAGLKGGAAIWRQLEELGTAVTAFDSNELLPLIRQGTRVDWFGGGRGKQNLGQRNWTLMEKLVLLLENIITDTYSRQMNCCSVNQQYFTRRYIHQVDESLSLVIIEQSHVTVVSTT